MKSTTSTVTTSLLILITFFHGKVVMACYIDFRKYSWLTYSWQENGRYSIPCVLFARSIDIRKGKGVLVATAFITSRRCMKCVISM